jgi:putative flippase GtrA
VKKILTRELILYGVFGLLTSALNIGLFKALLIAGMDYRFSNLITLIVVKLTAYAVNKVFVFRSPSESLSHLGLEFLRYTVTRGSTMLIDYFGLILLVDVLSVSKMAGKISLTILVVVLNYIFGKLIVFRKATPKP